MRFVLLGKFQSDALEKRFSWYRQMSGANYYISVRQLLESEKRIRVYSLLKFSGCSIEDLKSLGDDCEHFISEEELKDFVNNVQNFLPEEDDTLDDSDLQILFYVTGALVKVECDMRRCGSCKNLLIDSDAEQLKKLEVVNSEGLVSEDVGAFLKMISHGGLLTPTTEAFGIALKCWTVYNTIINNPELKSSFLHSKDVKQLFSKCVFQLLEEDSHFCEIAVTSLSCQKGHCFITSLAARFFNCMAKNYMRHLADVKEESKKRRPRKIAKLKSRSQKKPEYPKDVF